MSGTSFRWTIPHCRTTTPTPPRPITEGVWTASKRIKNSNKDSLHPFPLTLEPSVSAYQNRLRPWCTIAEPPIATAQPTLATTWECLYKQATPSNRLHSSFTTLFWCPDHPVSRFWLPGYWLSVTLAFCYKISIIKSTPNGYAAPHWARGVSTQKPRGFPVPVLQK
ncbi:hypothetical protein BJ508DRAFT_337150 [Ascobolus immersus RN42]|uniref:Uncharacterized protein n=1 Tax=Ascobolus immersus RN42 TaxID=1160509 RepID=A0A3N4H5A4_ASCIM|nr:hypothetical protein BJ508DRAFT_337150 [Ascobolus immersus RN42]